MIATEIDSPAAPATIHELLVDVDTWPVWSPHVASVTVETRRLTPGWHGATRAFFSPGATSMVVDDVHPDGGDTWHSTLGPWRLDYDNHVEPADDGSTLRFTARLSGPASAVIERLVAPLSALGQRRRMARSRI
ncbi:MAG: SRPBCC family protein, partial [Ilumatobacteraceae bacterium]